jgi:hypothetical protein
MLIIFYYIKGIVHKEFLLAGKTVTSTYYCEHVKMCEDVTLNFGNKETGCCIMTAHHPTLPFSPGNFKPKTTLLSSPTHFAHLT